MVLRILNDSDLYLKVIPEHAVPIFFDFVYGISGNRVGYRNYISSLWFRIEDIVQLAHHSVLFDTLSYSVSRVSVLQAHVRFDAMKLNKGHPIYAISYSAYTRISVTLPSIYFFARRRRPTNICLTCNSGP